MTDPHQPHHAHDAEIPHENPELAIPRETRCLKLTKDEHEFRLAYETGQESVVLQSLVEMVENPELPFDWFDAAVLGHQLGGHLAKELASNMPKKAA